MPATDLTTLANVKSWAGITDTTSDALLALMITQISDEIRNYTNRDIYPVTSYTVTLNGNGRDRQFMPQYPITAVASVTIDGTSVPVSTSPSMAGFCFDKNSILLRGYLFNTGVQNVAIAYSAGYAAIPPVIERVCIELIAHRFMSKTRIGYRSKSVAGETTTFNTDALPKSVEAVFKQWTRPYPV